MGLARNKTATKKFLVAYLSRDSAMVKTPYSGFTTALQFFPNIKSGAIAKNLVMSTAMAIIHR